MTHGSVRRALLLLGPASAIKAEDDLGPNFLDPNLLRLFPRRRHVLRKHDCANAPQSLHRFADHAGALVGVIDESEFVLGTPLLDPLQGVLLRGSPALALGRVVDLAGERRLNAVDHALVGLGLGAAEVLALPEPVIAVRAPIPRVHRLSARQ